VFFTPLPSPTFFGVTGPLGLEVKTSVAQIYRWVPDINMYNHQICISAYYLDVAYFPISNIIANWQT
jgi:hypothetical protein